MIQLKKLILDNFLSHSHTEIEMDDLQGLIMIDGHNVDGKYDSNGAGKSTVLEAIVYNITGQTLRKMGVNAMVNRSVGKNTKTHSQMTYRGKTIEIERYRKHDQFGDALVLTEDTKDISKRLNKETQDEIDSMLGVSYNVLTNTIFLGEGLSSKFTQLSDGDKKSLIESTLNLAYDFGASRNEANDKLKSIRNDLATAKGRITSLQGVLADLDKTSLGVKVADLTSQIQANESLLVDAQSNLSQSQVEYQTWNNEKLKLTRETSQVQQLRSQEQSVLSTVSQLKGLWSTAGQGGQCPVCKQSTTDPESMKHAQDHYMQQLQEQGTLLQGIKTQITSLRSLEDIATHVTQADQELSRAYSAFQTASTEVSRITGDISRMRSELSSSQDLLNNADKYEAEVSRLNEYVEELLKEEKIYVYWYEAFSPKGLLVKVLEEAVQYLNDRLSIYTDMLLERQYSMKLDKGKLTLTDPDDASYETLSNGEKRRLDLAIQFALHDYVHTYCGIQMDTLFIDEVLDTLDAIGISNIIDLLRVKLSYCGLARIFVITHNQDLKSYFDRVLLVTKDKKGFSTLSII